jgi:uncharacterized protein
MHMRYQRIGRLIQVRVERGAKVMETLLGVARREGLGYGVVNGLGAISWVRLAYLNADTKEYETHEMTEQLEVVSLIGNVALRDGQPFFHLHISCGRADLSMFGGHFLDAVANPTLEVSIAIEDGASVVRVPDPESGAAVMDLPAQG